MNEPPESNLIDCPDCLGRSWYALFLDGELTIEPCTCENGTVEMDYEAQKDLYYELKAEERYGNRR